MCGILVAQTGIESVPSALAVWSPNHWTTMEVRTHLHTLFALHFEDDNNYV